VPSGLPITGRGTTCPKDSTSWLKECSPASGYRTRVWLITDPVVLIRLNRRYQRTATMMTSGGNRKPANADFGNGAGQLQSRILVHHRPPQRTVTRCEPSPGGLCSPPPSPR
jgi:hypothetical protein